VIWAVPFHANAIRPMLSSGQNEPASPITQGPQVPAHSKVCQHARRGTFRSRLAPWAVVMRDGSNSLAQ